MANPFLNTVRLGEGYLNGGGSAFIGKNVNPDSLPGLDYGGLLGKILVVDDAEALRLSLTTTGTLRAGAYVRVKTKAGSAAAPARGIGAFWDTQVLNGFGTSVVTPDISATAIGSLAGIYVDAPAKGNYCWICVGGLVGLQVRAAVTSGIAGNIAVFTALATNTFDGIADATDYFATAGAYKTLVGKWYETPANGAINLAWLTLPSNPYLVG